MASNRPFRFGPVALTTTLTTNILSPPTTTGGTGVEADIANTYMLIRHIRIVNKTAAAATFSLYVGATGANSAGTEFMGTAQSVAANSYVDWYGATRLNSATPDFLVGGSGTATALTITGEGEIGVA
jgi:hypothetical protein